MIELRETSVAIEIVAAGTLTAEDYERVLPKLERLAARRGPLKFYIELRDFHGWTPAALWKDLRFDAQHQDDMARIAVVGESRWQEFGTIISQPFLKAEMRFFPVEEATDARRWLVEGHDEPGSRE